MKSDAKLVLATAFLCGLFVGALAFAIHQWATQVRNVGVVRVIGVQIYRDEALTDVLDIIDWGMISPGENKSVSAWVKNTGNDAQKLTMWTEAWSPTNASDWITLSWDYAGSWISVDSSIPVTFTLSVDTSITGITTFSFEVWVKGVH